MEKKVRSESELTFSEATSIIVGHGVGSGILAVPYLASRNSWLEILATIAIVYCVNLLMHYMIAELSLNNYGAQFIRCFRNELFQGKIGKIMTWIAFIFLGLSVLVNISGFIAGSAAVFFSWFGLPSPIGMLLYYSIASIAVLYGLKLVGICEKISVMSMVGVIGILFVASLMGGSTGFVNVSHGFGNVFALYSMVSFSLSAVMSVPQVVKGLRGDTDRIRKAIASGTGLNTVLILLITFMTLFAAGSNVSKNGALVDLAAQLGGWVGVIGYVFSLLALSTSFWANALNLRDIVFEQTGWNEKACYLLCTIPSLVFALFGASSFVGFTRLASVIQVLTGIGIIMSYHRSRKRIGERKIVGAFGTVPFEVLVIVGSLLATVGALIKVI